MTHAAYVPVQNAATVSSNTISSAATATVDIATQISLPTNVSPTNLASGEAPAGQNPSVTHFLNTWQNLSDTATNVIQSVGSIVLDISFKGECSATFPCKSVGDVETATFGNSTQISQTQMTALLQQITGQSDLALNATKIASTVNRVRLNTDDIILEAFSTAKSIRTDVLAGMVFDMYKNQASANGTAVNTNAVRATVASIPCKSTPNVPESICVYPSNADAKQARKFCRASVSDWVEVCKT